MARGTVSYLRISQDRANDGLAIDRQRGDITKLAADRGLTISAEYVDTVSASGRKRREQFEDLLDDIEAGLVETVVAWAWDRLARASKDALRIIDTCRVHRTRLMFVTDADMDVTTPGGELVASVRASVARNEVAQKSERQRAQRRQEAEQGRTPPTRRAFGYQQRERIVGEQYPVSRIDPEEARLVHEAYRQVLAGRSMGAVARWFTEQGSVTPRGRRWTHHNLRAVLVNPRYKGVRGVRMLLPGREGERGMREEFHTEVATGKWDAIVTPDVWDAVQTILRDPARRTNHPVNTAQYLLPFIARCGICGGHLITGSRVTVSRTNGEKVHDRLLRCHTLKHVQRKAAAIEEFVEEVLLAKLADPAARGVLRRLATPPHVDVDSIRQESSALRARKDEATAMWTDGTLDAASLRFAHRRADAQLQQLDARLAAAITTDPVLELASADAAESVWRAWPMDTKRKVVAARLDVVVHTGAPGRPGGRRFDPSTVDVTWKP